MKKKLVLSLDGGGVKGVMVARFLEHLEDAIAGHPYRSKQVDKRRHLAREFDMIAGTSAGALIAGALAYTNRSAHDLVYEVYSHENAEKMMPHRWRRIFGMLGPGPIYDGKGKKSVINECVDPHLLMSSSKDIHVLITGYDLETLRPVFFKSYDPSMDMSVATACDVSSAAPVYYPGVKASFSKTAYRSPMVGIDGGVFANDPSDCAYADALKLFGKESDIRVLSIGCGYSKKERTGNTFSKAMKLAKSGGLKWLTKGHLVDMLMEAPADCVKYRMAKFSEALGHKYMRINIELKNTSTDDVSEKNMKKLREKGTEMWEKNCAAVLDFLFV